MGADWLCGTVVSKISAEVVRRYFEYSPDTGVFTRKIACGRATAGDVAGSRKPHGYVKIMVCRESHYAHRLAWLYVTGEWPSERLDHKNGDRADNRFSNLRLATQSQNSINRNAKGVRINHCGRFTAQIGVESRSIYLGSFSSYREARDAYLKGVDKYFGSEWAARKSA